MNCPKEEVEGSICCWPDNVIKLWWRRLWYWNLPAIWSTWILNMQCGVWSAGQSDVDSFPGTPSFADVKFRRRLTINKIDLLISSMENPCGIFIDLLSGHMLLNRTDLVLEIKGNEAGVGFNLLILHLIPRTESHSTEVNALSPRMCS